MSIHFLDGRQLDLLRDYTPQQKNENSLIRAAVSMILRDGDQGTEVLMMQRAFHPKDPWSGQMAFPGGKIDPQDDSAKAAAVREAYEEVGADLSEQDYIGRLDDLYGLKVKDTYSVHVACFIYKPKKELSLVGNEEVADMVWLPLSNLSDPARAHDYTHPVDQSLSMPAVMINAAKDQILWGLSLRMLDNFYAVLGKSMDALSEEQMRVLKGIDQRQLSDSVRKNLEYELEKAKIREG